MDKSKKSEVSTISKLTKNGKLNDADLKKVLGGSINYNASKSNTGNGQGGGSGVGSTGIGSTNNN